MNGTTVTLPDGTPCTFSEGAWEEIGKFLVRAPQEDAIAEADVNQTINLPWEEINALTP